MVTDLEAESIDEERPRDRVVGRPEYGVAEFAGHHPLCALYSGRPVAGTFAPTGTVVGRGEHSVLGEPLGDLQTCASSGSPFDGAEPILPTLHLYAEAVQIAGSPLQVVAIVDSDVNVHEATRRRGHNAQLASCVPRGEPTLTVGPEPELLVVRSGFGRVGNTHGGGRRRPAASAADVVHCGMDTGR